MLRVVCAVATVRKILTILLSFFIFSKPFLPKYVLGLALFVAAFGIDYYDRKLKAADALLARQRAILAEPGTAAVGASATAASTTELLPLPAAQARN